MNGLRGEEGTFHSDASGSWRLSSLERTSPTLGFRGPDGGAVMREDVVVHSDVILEV